jgi:hypothetical protein
MEDDGRESQWVSNTKEIVDFSINHVMGGVYGAVNEVVRPGGSLDHVNLTKSILQGAIGGSRGPLSGMHTATSE